MWHLRTQPRVIEAFATLWESRELLTSFDGMSLMRPVAFKQEWRTAEGSWIHFDQVRVSVRPHLPNSLHS